jgi:hypothetical protein
MFCPLLSVPADEYIPCPHTNGISEKNEAARCCWWNSMAQECSFTTLAKAFTPRHVEVSTHEKTQSRWFRKDAD